MDSTGIGGADVTLRMLARFIIQMLARNPDVRPTVSDALTFIDANGQPLADNAAIGALLDERARSPAETQPRPS